MPGIPAWQRELPVVSPGHDHHLAGSTIHARVESSGSSQSGCVECFSVEQPHRTTGTQSCASWWFDSTRCTTGAP